MVESGGEEDRVAGWNEMRLGGWSLGWQAHALKFDWLAQCGDAPRPLLWESRKIDPRHRKSETARPWGLVFRQQEEL